MFPPPSTPRLGASRTPAPGWWQASDGQWYSPAHVPDSAFESAGPVDSRCPNGHVTSGTPYCPQCGVEIAVLLPPDSDATATSTVDSASELHDFETGDGPVPADRHSWGGGWVAESATVASTAFVGTDASVFDRAQVLESASVDGTAWVLGDARVDGDARIRGDAEVAGFAHVTDHAFVAGTCFVTDGAVVKDFAVVAGDARIGGDSVVEGNDRFFCDPSEVDPLDEGSTPSVESATQSATQSEYLGTDVEGMKSKDSDLAEASLDQTPQLRAEQLRRRQMFAEQRRLREEEQRPPSPSVTRCDACGRGPAIEMRIRRSAGIV